MVVIWWIRVTHRLRELARRKESEGQGLVEYALIIAFVAIFVIVALKFLQPQISNTLNLVANGL
jgi:pilus assembly protein Flp/PilA